MCVYKTYVIWQILM